VGLEVSNPEDDDDEVKLELDEPKALLDFLNAQRKKVAKASSRHSVFPTV